MAEQHSILNHDWELLVQALNASQSGIVITDPDLDDNPIIYVNEGFTRITGYEAEDILGKNCRFLQGQLTKNDDVKKIKQTLENFTSVSLTLLNYRKDGEIFYNQLTIDPVYNDKKQKYYFIGVQRDITNEVLYQQRLGDALAEIEQLSTPIVPLEEGISIVPLIGILSDKRVDILFSTLASYKALGSHHTLLIDLSGLVTYDERFAYHISTIYDWLKLMGIELILSGISPEMSMHLIQYKENLLRIRIFQNTQTALAQVPK